jgi:hypothetical protein
MQLKADEADIIHVQVMLVSVRHWCRAAAGYKTRSFHYAVLSEGRTLSVSFSALLCFAMYENFGTLKFALISTRSLVHAVLK